MLHEWGLRHSPGCDCGHRKQTALSHITDERTIRRFRGGVKELHEATTDAVQWLDLSGHTDLNEDLCKTCTRSSQLIT